MKVLGQVLLARLEIWAADNDILSPFQYGFRPGLSTVDQGLNLSLIIDKYTRAKDESLYLGFMDLSSAFDRVNRQKLWLLMDEIGVDNNLVQLLRDLHGPMMAVVRMDSEGRCSRTFNLERGVRQGCIMSPFLFTLYTNALGDTLMRIGEDAPRVGKSRIPILLYADDAVLISRTHRGLQVLLDAYASFMTSLDLNINCGKSHTMVLGKGHQKASSKSFFCQGIKLLNVPFFNYLGITFDQQSNWKQLLLSKKMLLAKSAGAVHDFSRSLGKKHYRAFCEIYRARCVSAVVYGAEIWGHIDSSMLQIQENKFIRRLLMLPQCSAVFSIHDELGLPFICDLIALKPLLYWLKVWIRAEPFMNRTILRDCLSLDRVDQIPWLMYLKKEFDGLGRPDLFQSPESICLADFHWVKKNFLLKKQSDREKSLFSKPLVLAHMKIKTVMGMEPYLQWVIRPTHLFYLIRFRFDMLHPFLSSVKGWSDRVLLGPCDCDNSSKQDLLHFILICTHYDMPRRCFLKPILKPYGFREAKVALMFLQQLNSHLVCFALGNYLLSAVKLRESMF